MSHVRSIAKRMRNESGAVLVMVALFTPVALLFFAFVADVSYAWLHQRHLQVQADAAALAGAQDYWPGCSNTQIYADAARYGGVASGQSYNAQTGGAASGTVYQLINSQKFYGQAPVDTTVNTADPCTAQMLDVKMTEAGMPWWLGGLDGLLSKVPFINAQARVEIRQLTTSGPGDMPVAVNDATFNSAEAFFIDESKGTVLGHANFGTPTSNSGLLAWTSGAYSLTVPTATGNGTSDVGVRIAMSAGNNLTGNMATDCAATGVSCYDTASNTAQLLDVHGYPTTGSGSTSSPIARQVVMTQGQCNDWYYTNATTDCGDGIQATLDLGANPNLSNTPITANVGSNSTTLNCTYNGTSKLTTCTGTITLTAGSGRNQVDIQVGNGKNAPTVTNVQSTYAAAISGNAGPIQGLGLYEGASGDVSSLQQGSTHSLVVQMITSADLAAAQSVGDPKYTMRLDGTGSQNQSVSCTPVSTPSGLSTWEAALATGCQGQYGMNQALTCPDTNTPVDCIPPATGNKQNNVAKALNYRILGSTSPNGCTSPNNWSSYPNLPAHDPRIVTVFVTPNGSFSGSGGSTSQQVPIVTFAAFYVTGWQGQGQGFTNPCQGHGDDTAAPGTIVGHFITYINALNTGSTGGTICQPNSLGECIAVMTR
jgi:Flp pilus assembly protein TadG